MTRLLLSCNIDVLFCHQPFYFNDGGYTITGTR